MATPRRLVARTIDLGKRVAGPGARRRVAAVPAVRQLDQWARNGPAGSADEESATEPPFSPKEWIQAFSPPNTYADDGPPVEWLGSRPSFRYKLEEVKRRRQMLREATGLTDPVARINDKLLAYVFADRHGLDHPEVYFSASSIDEVDWAQVPDSFVLKTRFGASNRGVKALRRQSPSVFEDLLRSRTWTIDEIIEDQARLEQDGRVSASLFAEELVEQPGRPGAVADDWKFYCFDGVAGLSMQRDINGSSSVADWRYAFRDRAWNDLGPVKFADRHDPTLTPPVDPAAMLAFAERVSALLAMPFMRIDILESSRGPLLGEFTPAPGPPEVWDANTDAWLGELWEQAETRLFARSIRSGDWAHLAVT